MTVWEPKQFYSQKMYDEYQAIQAKQPNVWMRVSPFEAPDLPADKYDFMLINLDYHDVYWESAKYGIPRMDPDQWLKTVYAAMKPGAVVGVVDHVANPSGDTRATVEKLHRIDPEVVKADFKRAGFQLVGSSDMLRNPADDHSPAGVRPEHPRQDRPLRSQVPEAALSGTTGRSRQRKPREASALIGRWPRWSSDCCSASAAEALAGRSRTTRRCPSPRSSAPCG